MLRAALLTLQYAHEHGTIGLTKTRRSTYDDRRHHSAPSWVGSAWFLQLRQNPLNGRSSDQPQTC
jgi:hypothetical protein